VKLLLDMNLSPALGTLISQYGHDVLRRSEVGDQRASDLTILRWAREHDHVLVTHDLDFAAILAETDATAPSVIQVRRPARRDVAAVATPPIRRGRGSSRDGR
jgi:predicted nuclease of predicted toxin-antitoxin system